MDWKLPAKPRISDESSTHKTCFSYCV